VSETLSQIDALSTARTYIRLVRLLEQQARYHPDDEPLTLTELGVLGQIDRGQALPSLIARSLALDPARVTRITDHLHGLGYIEREADPDDRRRCPLRITESGAARLARGRLYFRDAMAAILQGLTEEERAGLSVGTDGLARVLDEVRTQQ
jgi:DNA-binding MarR family transcriptional regulator